jgi:hypothetical protein
MNQRILAVNSYLQEESLEPRLDSGAAFLSTLAGWSCVGTLGVGLGLSERV